MRPGKHVDMAYTKFICDFASRVFVADRPCQLFTEISALDVAQGDHFSKYGLYQHFAKTRIFSKPSGIGPGRLLRTCFHKEPCADSWKHAQVFSEVAKCARYLGPMSHHFNCTEAGTPNAGFVLRNMHGVTIRIYGNRMPSFLPSVRY